jgi:hypothetical protein
MTTPPGKIFGQGVARSQDAGDEKLRLRQLNFVLANS